MIIVISEKLISVKKALALIDQKVSLFKFARKHNVSYVTLKKWIEDKIIPGYIIVKEPMSIERLSYVIKPMKEVKTDGRTTTKLDKEHTTNDSNK